MLNGGNVASPRRTEGVEVLKWWKVVVSLKIQETQNVMRRVCFFWVEFAYTSCAERLNEDIVPCLMV